MLVKIRFYPVAVEKEILHSSFSMKTIQEARLFPTETTTELDLKQNKNIQMVFEIPFQSSDTFRGFRKVFEFHNR